MSPEWASALTASALVDQVAGLTCTFAVGVLRHRTVEEIMAAVQSMREHAGQKGSVPLVESAIRSLEESVQEFARERRPEPAPPQ